MSTKTDLLERYGLDLEAAVSKLISSGNWIQLLDISARFAAYSSQNILLLFSQACSRGFSPTLVAGYRGWQRLGRQVKAGEKALYIVAPKMRKASSRQVAPEEDFQVLIGFRMVGVFDLCQTMGDDLAMPPQPQLLDSESPLIPALVQRLIKLMDVRGFSVEFEPLEGANGLTDFESTSVKVRSDVPSLQQLKTLLHETAHVLLHQHRLVSRGEAELEAESCAYVVCRALGFDSSSYSFPYVARWSLGDIDLVCRVVRSVHHTAREIIKFLEE